MSDIRGGAPDLDTLMDLIAQDKKVKRGKLTFILARGIGAAFVAPDVDPRDVRAFLGEKLSLTSNSGNKTSGPMSTLDLLIIFAVVHLPAGFVPVFRQRDRADDIVARGDDAARKAGQRQTRGWSIGCWRGANSSSARC